MNGNPIACSLDAEDLQSRLAEIEALGAASLLSYGQEGEQHVLRFRGDARTRQHLEAIVAVERECCPFLELDLTPDGEQLTLSIAAPAEAAAVAAALAERFFSR